MISEVPLTGVNVARLCFRPPALPRCTYILSICVLTRQNVDIIVRKYRYILMKLSLTRGWSNKRFLQSPSNCVYGVHVYGAFEQVNHHIPPSEKTVFLSRFLDIIQINCILHLYLVLLLFRELIPFCYLDLVQSRIYTFLFDNINVLFAAVFDRFICLSSK